jgi:hypothetical protein
MEPATEGTILNFRVSVHCVVIRPDFHKEIDQMTVTTMQRFNVDILVEENERRRISSLKRNALLLSEFLHKSFVHSTYIRE